eukprot:COSAG06_NODE_1794_length_8377_cov_116.203068_9_plen_55_part_00
MTAQQQHANIKLKLVTTWCVPPTYGNDTPHHIDSYPISYRTVQYSTVQYSNVAA